MFWPGIWGHEAACRFSVRLWSRPQGCTQRGANHITREYLSDSAVQLCSAQALPLRKHLHVPPRALCSPVVGTKDMTSEEDDWQQSRTYDLTQQDSGKWAVQSSGEHAVSNPWEVTARCACFAHPSGEDSSSRYLTGLLKILSDVISFPVLQNAVDPVSHQQSPVMASYSGGLYYVPLSRDSSCTEQGKKEETSGRILREVYLSCLSFPAIGPMRPDFRHRTAGSWASEPCFFPRPTPLSSAPTSYSGMGGRGAGESGKTERKKTL